MRHARVGMLWIQEQVEDGTLDIKKINGENNPADALTKNVPQRKLIGLTEKAIQKQRDGRAETGLVLAPNSVGVGV